MLTDARKAELSEIVDSVIFCAEVSNWECLDDFTQEIMDNMEDQTEMNEDEYHFCSECCADYWTSCDGDNQTSEDDEE